MVDIPKDNELDDTLSESDQDVQNDEPSQQALLAMLADLKNEHRRIDTEISALTNIGAVDMLKIGRMKKIKLSIKDQVLYLENQLTPDIIA